jgi:PleD family two-component response regulator
LCQGELVDGKDVFLQNSFVSCARLTFQFLRTLRFSKKECPSESVTGHQLDTSAANNLPTLSTPSVLAIAIRVLIVEDHLANRILLEAMVNKRSNQDVCYEIETVENGLEAVQIASSRHYKIILMDCNMPIMDGWQVRISERHKETERQRLYSS